MPFVLKLSENSLTTALSMSKRRLLALAALSVPSFVSRVCGAESGAPQPPAPGASPVGIEATITFFCALPTQLEACHKFYGGLLGLPLVMQTETVRLYRTSATSFFGLTAGPARQPAPGGAILELTTSSRAEVDRRFRELTAAQVHTDGAPRDVKAIGAYGFFANDPQGYLVEILHFPALMRL